MNKKIVCLVLALAMILTVGLALAADGGHDEHHHNYGTIYRDSPTPDATSAKNYKVIEYATCTTSGKVRWFCLEEFEKAPGDTAAQKMEYLEKSGQEGQEFIDQIVPALGINLPEAVTDLLPEDLSTVKSDAATKLVTELRNVASGTIYYTDAADGKVKTQDLASGWNYTVVPNLTCKAGVTQYIEYACANKDANKSTRWQASDTACFWVWKKAQNGGQWCLYKKCTGTHKITITMDHTPSEDFRVPEGKDFGCGDVGAYMERYCKKCDVGLEQTSLEGLTHYWGDPELVTPGTCVDVAVWKHTCQKCGKVETYTGTTDTKNHVWSDVWLVDKAPTCEDKGMEVMLCAKCGVGRMEREVAPLGHDQIIPEEKCIDQAIYCARPGCKYAKGGSEEKDNLKERKPSTVQMDLDEKEDPVEYKWYVPANPLKHPSEYVTNLPLLDVPVTCWKEGSHAFHCSLCCDETKNGKDCEIEKLKKAGKELNAANIDKSLIETVKIPKVDHELTVLATTKAPTCVEKGEGYYVCKWWRYDGNGDPSYDAFKAHRKTNNNGAGEYYDPQKAAMPTAEQWDKWITWNKGCASERIDLDPLGHTVAEWHFLDPDATRGRATGTCDRCGWVIEYNVNDKSELCAKTGHIPYDETKDKATLVKGKDSTCMEEGWKDYYICRNCGAPADVETAKDKVVIAKKPHDFNAKNGLATYVIEPKEATCTTEGSKGVIKCANCDTTDTTEAEAKIPKLPHTPEEVAEKAATCGAAGVAKHYKCSVCDEPYVDEKGAALTEEQIAALAIPATGKHTLVETAEKKDPTCTEAGYTAAQKCTVCGEVVPSDVIPAKGHTTTKVAEKPATCTVDGTKAYELCSVCRKKLIDGKEVADADLVIKAAHKPVAKEAVAATCGKAGLKAHYECSVCGEYVTEAGVLLTAEEKAALATEATGEHTYVYTGAKEATCTEVGTTGTGKCSVCGAEVEAKEIAKKAHTPGEEKAAVPATCGKAGLAAHYECTVCGTYVTKDGVALTDAEKAALTLAATGKHTLEVTTEAKLPTCTEPGYTSATKCTVCDYVEKADEIPALGHKTEKVEAKAATCTTAGAKAYEICTICLKTFIDGEEVKAEDLVVAPLDHDFTVEVAAVPATHLEKGTTAGLKCSRCDVTKGIEEVDYLKGMFKDADGKVNYFSNGKIDTEFAGMCDFEGGKFYVKNGAVDTTLMGVSDVAYETEGVFYFFDHGQVQTQYTGRASYDGENFLLKDGKVRLDYEGTYVEEGQTFWVSVGRICSELNGAHPEEDGVYYYGEGRRVPCNGIATYMGSYFYFENGKMVNATMEYKDFNGNAWNIVNGQAYPLF